MWKIKTSNKKIESDLIKNGYSRLISRLVSQRNIANIDMFIDPEYGKMKDPKSINDMDKANKIFIDAILSKKKIAVLGDYDADGVVSSVMLTEICRMLNHTCDVFLPSRLKHNYGLSGKSAEAFIEKHRENPPYLVFLLDCGSNSYSEIERLKTIGIQKIIVVDHHIINEETASRNADCFVNWHLSEVKEEMCTCGLMLQFARGLRYKTKKVNPISLLTYAAVGTIADVSPVYGDNRIIVKNGLTGYAINSVPSAGLQSILGHNEKFSPMKKGYLTQEDVSFKIAPIINAVGRMYHPDMAYNLLIESDPAVADKMAEEVIECNEERKNLQKMTEIEAVSIVKENDADNIKHGIIVYDKNWHIGVVGIVASRLVEEFGKPSIVIGCHDGVWRGSGRSIIGVNIKEILDGCSHMFDSYGGHEMACGVTIKKEYLCVAQSVFEEECKKHYEKNKINNVVVREYDANIKADAVTINNARDLIDKMAPYCGNINPEPIFKINSAKITCSEIFSFKKGKYLVLKIKIEKNGKKIEHSFMSFQLAKRFPTDISGKTFDVYFKFPQSVDSGRFELQLIDLIENVEIN